MLRDFFTRIEADDDMQGIDITDDTFVVKHVPTGYHLFIVVDAILELDYDTIKRFAAGLQRLDPLYHVSRIVGYYSRIQNWNKSKHGELRDRRKGTYTIEA
jgi:hypothetical protein